MLHLKTSAQSITDRDSLRVSRKHDALPRRIHRQSPDMPPDHLLCLLRKTVIEILTFLAFESLTLHRIYRCIFRIIPLGLSLSLLEICQHKNGNKKCEIPQHSV